MNKTSRIEFSSTKFYLNRDTDGNLVPSINGTLYNVEGSQDWKEVENYENQLKDYLSNFKYKPLNDTSKDDIYSEEITKLEDKLGRGLTVREINTVYESVYLS